MENTATDTKINPMAYRPIPFPAMPKRVTEYYQLDSSIREKMNKQAEDFKGLWFDPEVKAYFDARDKVIATNWSYRRFLNILRTEAVEKKQDTSEIDNVLGLFIPKDYLFPIELRGREDVPDEIQEVVSVMGGKATDYRRKEWQE